MIYLQYGGYRVTQDLSMYRDMENHCDKYRLWSCHATKSACRILTRQSAVLFQFKW